MLSEELDRQDFEAWFVPIYHPRHMNRNNAGDYLFIDAEIAWTAWKARNAELLSLREQLEALKNQEPIAWGLADKNDIAYYNECCIGDKGVMEDEASNYNDYADSEDDFIHVIPLFTAAKPADSVTLPAPANYEDYGPMVSLEKTMAALALCGIEYTVKK